MWYNNQSNKWKFTHPQFRLNYKWEHTWEKRKEWCRKVGLYGLKDVSKLAPIGDLDYMNGWYPCGFFPEYGTWMKGGIERAIYEAAIAQGYYFECISHRETGSDTCYFCKDLHCYYHVDSSG